MSEGFIYKLGEFKSEKMDRGFTRLHNDTFFEISKKLGAEASTLYIALSTYAFGSSVTAFPKLESIADKLGISRPTIKRWKKKLVEEKVIRAIPCYQINGMRTVDVVLFNASYPEIPEAWDAFAQNGMVMVNGRPMTVEDWQSVKEAAFTSMQEIAVTSVGSKMNLPTQSIVQNRAYPSYSGFSSDPTVGSKMNLPINPEIPVVARDKKRFSEGEEEKINKKNKDLVVELAQHFKSQTGETITDQKIQTLIDSYGADRIREGINIILNLYEWPIGAEGALVAALRDGWKQPTPRENTKKPKRQEQKFESKTSQRDERYSAFYDLFPDE